MYVCFMLCRTRHVASHLIRVLCFQVFFVQVDESRLTVDAMEITQFSETLANSTCSALAPFLNQLHEQGMKKVALRVTLGPEQVC